MNIKPTTICQRVLCQSNHGTGTDSPLKKIEPVLVELCIHLNRLALSIDKETFLGLASDLIAGHSIEQELIEWKKAKGIPDGNLLGNLVGDKYYKGFLRRNCNQIHTTSVNK